MGEEARVLNVRNFPPLILATVFSVVVTGCTNQPSRIVYRVPDSSSGKNDLFVIREDGTHDAVLANSGDDQAACGVTTDRRVVFTRQAPTGGRIYIVSEDGSGSRPLRATADDETCFGVTGNDMVIFGINLPPVNLVPNHDLYSISANSSATPIALAASAADELPVAISWDNRVIFARREAQVNGHWFSFYSIGDDGANMAPLVGVFEQPTFVAVSSGNRMIFSVPTSSTLGPPDTYEALSSVTTSPPRLISGLNQFLHYIHPVGDRFCGFTLSGRTLLTSRSFDQIDGQDTFNGAIYSMNDDGTNVVLINPGPRHFNEICLAGHDNWIIVGRYADNISEPWNDPASLWSYPASGAGGPIQLAATPVWFQGLTPYGRALFLKRDQAENMLVLQSIAADGTDLQTLATFPLATSSASVAAFTPLSFTPSIDRVALEVFDQGSLKYLGIVPSQAQTPLAPLTTRPGVPSFVYYIDGASGRAARCRFCLLGTDRGGSPLPVGPPFP
jgi:hypothetical protein